MLLAFDGATLGENWTTVLPSKIDVDFFYSAYQHIDVLKEGKTGRKWTWMWA